MLCITFEIDELPICVLTSAVLFQILLEVREERETPQLNRDSNGGPVVAKLSACSKRTKIIRCFSYLEEGSNLL